MRWKKFAAAAAIAALCAGAVLLTRLFAPNSEEVMKKRIAERSLGSDKAPVWVTEYIDYQCPPCAAGAKLLKKAMEEHPGQIYLQARYFPLPAHKNALKAAVYAECASRQKGKFWAFHEKVFENQKEWAQDPYAQIRFAAYAETAGLDLKKLDACSHDPEIEKAVMAEKEKASELGVKITPTFFVNGKMVVGTNRLAAEIASALEKKEAKP
jgi:protein-disulfide isomerase